MEILHTILGDDIQAGLLTVIIAATRILESKHTDIFISVFTAAIFLLLFFLIRHLIPLNKNMKTLIYHLMGVVCLLATSCVGGGEDPFAGVDLYGQNLPATLTAYHDLHAGKEQKAGPTALYIDFSAGMHTAFGTPLIRESMSQCFNTLLSEHFAAYKLAQGRVDSLQVSNSTQLGQVVGDPKQYLDRRAPIQAAVQKIVSSKNDALLITDFEEWQDNAEVTSTAYLKIPFSKWLSAGNSITFFIADYKEGTADKHIYFTVFTYGRASAESLITRIRPKLSAFPAKFDLATDAYAITTKYTKPKLGGIFQDTNGSTAAAQNILDVETGYLYGPDQNRLFEYYPLGLDWTTIAETQQEYAAQNQFKDLFRGLYLDLTNNDSYEYGDFDVKTYDVTEDFERFVKSVEAGKHKPTMTKNADGDNQISEKETDPVALACYEQNGTVKKEFTYEKASNSALSDVFVLNKALFDNTLKENKKQVEAGVSFSSQFSTAKLPDPHRLMRVDLVLKQASVNAGNPVLQKFKWTSASGVSNVALYESIMNTLNDLKPQDQTVYTYYLKTTEQ